MSLRRSVAQLDAVHEPGQLRFVRDALYLCPVRFGGLVFGLADAGLQATIVSQQQQAFTVEIQPAGRIDAPGIDVVPKRRPASRVTKLAQYAVWLVETY